MLEIMLFDWPYLLTTPSTALHIHAVLIAHAQAQLKHGSSVKSQIVEMSCSACGVHVCALESSSYSWLILHPLAINFYVIP